MSYSTSRSHNATENNDLIPYPSTATNNDPSQPYNIVPVYHPRNSIEHILGLVNGLKGNILWHYATEAS